MTYTRGILIVLALIPATRATTIYTYDSPSYTTRTEYMRDHGGYWCPPITCDHLSVSLLFAQPLSANLTSAEAEPLAWYISDGIHYLSNDGEAVGAFGFATGATGIPINFGLSITLDRVGGDDRTLFSASTGLTLEYNVTGGVFTPGIGETPIVGSSASVAGVGSWSIIDTAPLQTPESTTFGIVAGVLAVIGIADRRRKTTRLGL